MKRILAALLIFPVLAYGAAFDMRMEQRNATDTASLTRLVPFPAGGADGLFWFNGATTLPSVVTLGTGLSITSGVLNSASQVNADWSAVSGVSQILNKPTLATVATSGAYTDLSGSPTLGTSAALNVAAAGNAASGEVVKGNDTRLTDARAPLAHTHVAADISNSTTVGRAVLTAVDAAAARSAIGAGTGNGSVTSVTAGTGLSGGVITTTGTISMPNTGTAGTYSGVTTDAQGRVTSGTNRSFSYTTRALNTCFQVSSTRDALVTYSVDIATSLSLTSGQQGTVYLRIYTNSGCSTGTQEVTRFVNGNTGVLAIGLALNQNVTGTLTGIIPAGSYVQLVTENNTGTPTFTARPGQEVLM